VLIVFVTVLGTQSLQLLAAVVFLTGMLTLLGMFSHACLLLLIIAHFTLHSFVPYVCVARLYW
jgi:hypothetical protein